MKPGNMHLTGDCRAISEVLARIGDKWTVLVVNLMGGGPKRFSEIKREVGGISQRMLTLTLRALERDGLVTRTVTPEHPAARRLRTDRSRPLAAGARAGARRLGARQPRKDGAGPPHVRCRYDAESRIGYRSMEGDRVKARSRWSAEPAPYLASTFSVPAAWNMRA